MDSCERVFVKIIYILIMIYGLCIFIFSTIQISKDYGYKNILSLIENFVIYLEESNEYCDKYISDIKSSIKLTKAKTILNLLFNIYRVIYSFIRIKNLDKNCKIGILFFLILFSEHIIVLSLTSAVVNEYDFKDYYHFDICFTSYNQKIIIEDESFKEEQNNSNYVRKLNLVIISLNAISSGIMVFLGWMQLKPDCNASNLVETDFFLNWDS